MKWTDINLRGRTSGTVKTTCPECSPTRRNKKDLCLSVDIDSGLYNCHHCGAKGGKKEYKPKEYVPVVMPKLNTTDLCEKTFNYFQTRHISTTTIKRNRITEGLHYFGQEGKEMNAIWFNYFKGGEHVNTKFRNGKKQFTQVKGAPKHFYKIDDVTDKVIITEGEWDALSWEEAGYLYAVSVPDGALPPNAEYSDTKFEYINNDIEILLGCKEVYLSIDNDEAGQHLQKELSRRIGRERCFIIDLGQYKDANEVLQDLGRVDGIDYLKAAYDSAKPYPIEGAQYVNGYIDELVNIYHNGFSNGVGVGFMELDQHVRWMDSLLYVVTGIPSHGKSNFLDQIVIKLMERSDWKFAVYSPEHPPQMHLHRLAKILLQLPFHGDGRMSEQDLRDCLGWLNERIFFIMPDNDDFGLENILTISKQLVSQKGVNCLILDPWNTIDHHTPKGMDKGDYISKSLTKLKIFNKQQDAAVFLVAHPTKMPKNEDGTYKVPTGYNVSDSAHFYNKADIGLTVYRNFDTGIVDVHLWKIKFEGVLGKQGTVQFTYDKITGGYKELNSVEYEKEIQQGKKVTSPKQDDFGFEDGFNDVPF